MNPTQYTYCLDKDLPGFVEKIASHLVNTAAADPYTATIDFLRAQRAELRSGGVCVAGSNVGGGWLRVVFPDGTIGAEVDRIPFDSEYSSQLIACAAPPPPVVVRQGALSAGPSPEPSSGPSPTANPNRNNDESNNDGDLDSTPKTKEESHGAYSDDSFDVESDSGDVAKKNSGHAANGGQSDGGQRPENADDGTTPTRSRRGSTNAAEFPDRRRSIHGTLGHATSSSDHPPPRPAGRGSFIGGSFVETPSGVASTAAPPGAIRSMSMSASTRPQSAMSAAQRQRELFDAKYPAVFLATAPPGLGTGTIRKYHARTGELLEEVDLPRRVSCLAVHRRRGHLYVALEGGTIYLFDMELAQLDSLPVPSAQCMAIDDAQGSLWVCNAGKEIERRKLGTGVLERAVSLPDSMSAPTTFLGCGDRLFVASANPDGTANYIGVYDTHLRSLAAGAQALPVGCIMALDEERRGVWQVARQGHSTLAFQSAVSGQRTVSYDWMSTGAEKAQVRHSNIAVDAATAMVWLLVMDGRGTKLRLLDPLTGSTRHTVNVPTVGSRVSHMVSL